MQCGLKLRNYQITKLQNSSRGYILITLMLFFALLAIAAMAVLPEIAFQIKRDREEEMIHRALEYSRAVKRYYKKFGRYPSRMEELENTNNIRFLRKRYKDPIMGRDFKILHLTDIMLNSGPVLGQPAGQAPFGQPGVGGGTLPPSPSTPNMGAGLPPPANAGDQNAQGDDSNNLPGSSPNTGSSQSASSNPISGPGGSNPGGQLFGGGPILGVASTSKAKSIREFNKKDHYNDWLFIYDPQSDRGGMLNTPVQPGLNSNFSPGALPGAGPGQVVPNAGPSQPQGPPNPAPMPPEQ
jgi:type II secretory pathway pseudopilin PulG